MSALQPVQWLKFGAALDKGHPEAAAYHCEGCERAIAEHHKRHLWKSGRVAATAGCRSDPGTVRLSSSRRFNSPIAGSSWKRIVRMGGGTKFG